ncbi:MAG: hypothetical protein AB1414_07085 [bacterium]
MAEETLTEKIEVKREESRIKVVIMLIWLSGVLITISIITGSILLYILPVDKFSFKDMLNLVLVVWSIFSGLLGCAVTFYFSSKG